MNVALTISLSMCLIAYSYKLLVDATAKAYHLRTLRKANGDD